MRTEIEEVTVKLSGSECYEIALCFFSDMKGSIERHYNHLQQDTDGESSFYDMCSKKIKMMNDFFLCGGYPNMIEHTDKTFKEMFSDRKKERAEKAKENAK